MSRRIFKVHGVDWVCDFGKGVVSIRSPYDGRRRVVSRVVSYAAVTGLSPDTVERGQWKKTSDGMVTPAVVKRYIVERMPTPGEIR